MTNKASDEEKYFLLLQRYLIIKKRRKKKKSVWCITFMLVENQKEFQQKHLTSTVTLELELQYSC